MTLFTLLVGLLTASPGSPAHHQTNGCPAETELSRRALTFFAASPAYAQSRQQHGLASVDSAGVRLLSGEQDAETCRRLWQFLHRLPNDPGVRDLPVFYEAGGHYYLFVDLESKRPPLPAGRVYIDTRLRSMYVLDHQFKQIAAIAM